MNPAPYTGRGKTERAVADMRCWRQRLGQLGPSQGPSGCLGLGSQGPGLGFRV